MVGINEPPNTKRVQEDILADRQGFTDEIGAALAYGVVEAFDGRCFASEAALWADVSGRSTKVTMPAPAVNRAITVTAI